MEFKAYFISLACADALGRAFHGMKQGHIAAHFPSRDGFPDTLAALKGHEQLWVKPGLYGAVTQCALVAAMHTARRRDPLAGLAGALDGFESSTELPWGPLRQPDAGFSRIAERALGRPVDGTGAAAPSLPVFLLSAALAHPDGLAPAACAGMAAAVSTEVYSVAAAVAAGSLQYYTDGSSAAYAASALKELSGDRDVARMLFEHGVNPATVEAAFVRTAALLDAVAFATDEAAAEALIAKDIGAITGNNITRGTVDHPLAVLAMGLLIADRTERPGLSAAWRGGASAWYAPLAAAVGFLRGEAMPESLAAGLVNRRRLAERAEAVESGRGSVDAAAFLAEELPLSRKESEERQARCRHRDAPARKPLTRQSAEERMSRHVVESWTKDDRARFRREKRRSGRDDEDNHQDES